MRSLIPNRLLSVSVTVSCLSLNAAVFTYQITPQSQASFNFTPLVDLSQNRLTGTLDSISIDAVLISAEAPTWAHDISLLLYSSARTELDMIVGGPALDGVFIRPTQRYYWPNGKGGSGTSVTGVINLNTPFHFTGNPDVDGFLLIGNGYLRAGLWSGSVSFHGLTLTPIPEPDANLGVFAGLLLAATLWLRQARLRK